MDAERHSMGLYWVHGWTAENYGSVYQKQHRVNRGPMSVYLLQKLVCVLKTFVISLFV